MRGEKCEGSDWNVVGDVGCVLLIRVGVSGPSQAVGECEGGEPLR